MARKNQNSTALVAMTVITTVITALAMLWPAVAFVIPQSSTATTDPVTITDYNADFRVDKDGQLTAVETLTTSFPCCRHGIFRFWEVSAPWDSHQRLIPEDIKVTLDGQSENFELSWQRGRKYRVAKIGSADRTLDPGTHVYTISYTIDGALAPSSAGAVKGESSSWASDGKGSVFYWNVVAGGWQMQIDKSTSRVTLPTTADEVKCTYGFDSAGTCKVSGGGTDGIVIRTDALGPRTPVTVRATQDIATPDRVTVPWAPIYDGVLGTSFPLALVIGILALIGFFVGRMWEWTTREDTPGYPVMYQPPPGLGPVQAYYVMHEKVPSHGLIATLLYQAERGLTTLTQSGKDWLVTGTGGDWTQVDAVTRSVGESLGVTGQGATFNANGTIAAGQSLTTVNTSLGAEVKSWSRTQGLIAGKGLETLGRLLVLAAGALAALMIFTHPGGITLFALPFAGFAIGGVGMLLSGVGTRRTPAGRDQWSRSGGFYRLLSTPSAQDRFDFSAHKELYTAYIPFAVVFDCADKWAEKYQLHTGEVPPSPTWYVGPHVGGGFLGSSSSFASFESSLHSSIGAYEASQSSSSSSSGGGGFSGGGGGGGGGGGSW